MSEMMMEGAIVVSAFVSASLMQKKSSQKARKVFAIAFVLMTAACIAFSVAQAAAAFGLLRAVQPHTPFEALSLLAVVYWLSYAVSQGTMFDKMVGEKQTNRNS